MAHSPSSTTGNTVDGNPSGQFEMHLEDLDFVDSAVTQAEIGLIEHYFQEMLKDLTKGSPP